MFNTLKKKSIIIHKNQKSLLVQILLILDRIFNKNY